MAVTLSSCYLL